MKTGPDDLDAVRSVVAALEKFEPTEQERILRWAREKLGLSTGAPTPASLGIAGDDVRPNTERTLPTPSVASTHSSNIKTFVALKNPKSDRQFAATVAYFYKFEAADSERKSAITGTDLQDACRKAGRERLKNPGQTLINAHNQGYLDKAGDRGAYALNTVGENLIAMTLPEEGSANVPSFTSAGQKTRKRAQSRRRRKG